MKARVRKLRWKVSSDRTLAASAMASLLIQKGDRDSLKRLVYASAMTEKRTVKIPAPRIAQTQKKALPACVWGA